MWGILVPGQSWFGLALMVEDVHAMAPNWSLMAARKRSADVGQGAPGMQEDAAASRRRWGCPSVGKGFPKETGRSRRGEEMQETGLDRQLGAAAAMATGRDATASSLSDAAANQLICRPRQPGVRCCWRRHLNHKVRQAPGAMLVCLSGCLSAGVRW